VVLYGRLWVNDETTPHAGVVEGAEFEASNDPEVVITAFEDSKEIWMRSLGCGHDATVSENNLELDDVVADQTPPRREVRDSTAERKTTDADCGRASTTCHRVQWLQGIVHVVPSCRRADFDQSLLGIILNGAEIVQVECYAVLDIGGSNVWSVSTTTNRKLA